MGQELSTATKPGLQICRHITGFAAGQAPIHKVEVLRNGKVIKTFTPESNHFEFSFDDMDPLPKITLSGKDKGVPFVYYYLRVTQENGHMAWSSPIWVDYVPVKATSKHTGKKPVKPVPKVEVKELDLNDFDDDEFDDFDEDDE